MSAAESDSTLVAFPPRPGVTGDYVWDFNELNAGKTFQVQTATIFRARIDGVDGTWTRPRTAVTAWTHLNKLTMVANDVGAWLDNVNDITDVVWKSFLSALPEPGRADMVRALLLDCPSLTGDALSAVAPALPARKRNVQPSITDEDVLRIGKALWLTCRAAHQRITSSRARLAEYRSNPGMFTGTDLLIVQALDQLDRTGIPVPYSDHSPGRHPNDIAIPTELRRAFGGELGAMFRHLFLEGPELAAYMLLITLVTGINPGAALELDATAISRVDALDGSEPAMFAGTVYKPRRGHAAYSDETWIDTGPGSAGEAIRMLLGIATPAREWLDRVYQRPTSRALLAHTQRRWGETLADPAVRAVELPKDQRTLQRWIGQWWESPDTQAPADLSWVRAQTLRRWFVTRERPQGHSEPVHLDDYLLRDDRVRAESMAITEAVLNSQIAATLASTDPEPGTGEETVASTCADHDHSPLSGGGRCLVSFLLCLKCPVATIAPMHLPRWLLIRDSLEQAAGLVSDALWSQTYQEHHERVTDLLTPGKHYSQAVLDHARASVTDKDRAIVQQLMNREFDTT